MGDKGYIRGPFGSALKRAELKESGIPVYEQQHAIDGVRTFRYFIDDDKYSELRRFTVEPHDLIISCSGTVGRISVIQADDPRGIISQALLILRPDVEKVLPYYLYYFLTSKAGAQELVNASHGAVQLNIAPRNIVEKIPVPLPADIEIQRQIVRQLKTVDDKINLNRRINQTLEAVAQTIFKSWFVDFDPVKAKIAAIQEGRDPLRAAMTAISGKPDAELVALPPEQYAPLAATAVLFPDEMKDSELGEIPKEWAAKSLDSIANYLNGLALQKSPPKSSSDFLPVIKIAQLRAGHTEGADQAASDLKPEYVVCDGDVLFSWSGSLEVDVWTGGRGALNQHLFKVTSSVVPKWFYLLATKYYLPQFREIAANKATTMGHIQRKHLSDARIATPLSEFLDQATKVVSPLLNQIISLRLQSRELTKARDTLLPKLLSGELSVADAIPEVEA